MIALAGFAAASLVILFAGVRLARYGDALGAKTGVGGTWMGLVAMAMVTSLPELVTGVSSIALYSLPDVAAGDAIGSCMFNLLILALLDVRHPEPISARVHQGHVLAAALGMVALGLAALTMLAGGHMPALGWIGVSSFAFIALYVFGVRLIFGYERARAAELTREVGGADGYAELSLAKTAWLYLAHALLLVAAATYLPGAAEQLALATGLGQGFVGSSFVAISTSLPEVVVSIAAARIGAIDMAVAGLFGSNMFNVAVLGLDDFVYRDGVLLARVSRVHLVSLVSAIVMTAFAVIGMTYRARRKRLLLSWDTLFIVAMYLVGVVLMWKLD
jgi:cation:H+ antiporter